MIAPAPRRLVWFTFAAVALLSFVSPNTASAVPAFARKYQTSCQTCHIVFPKLNAFGEAFRLRGYRMPAETEDQVKQKPVSLGAPAYKRLWPKAVWPGELPGNVPLAVNVKFADVNQSFVNPDGSLTSIKNDFQFPQEANIFGAGTLGDKVSFFSEMTFGENPDGSVEVELEHARIDFDSPFGKEDLFHFRIGKMAPNVADGFQEMWIATDAPIGSVFGYDPIGVNGGTSITDEANGISLPDRVRGIEAYGIVAHRFFWVGGVVNGMGPGANGVSFDGNNSKDLYARVDYKFGGMGLDGDMGGKEPPAQNWRDNSLRVGLFVYRGNGSNMLFPAADAAGNSLALEDPHYLRKGVYASVFFQDLNLFGVYMHGTDQINAFADAAALGLPAVITSASDIGDLAAGTPLGLLSTIQPGFRTWFLQADYVFYPWLQGSARYETLVPGDGSVPSLRTGVFNVSALIRANVKAMVELQRDLRDGRNHSLNGLVRFAF